ncbi:MAG: RIO1 family regulatory kinase/ATPase [Candidatus Nezhaarchaeales archaeon]
MIDIAKWASVLCYPRVVEEELRARLREAEDLGVEDLVDRGRVLIGSTRVLGKGCVGIVVEAVVSSKKAVLKIRRVDADRRSLESEAAMLMRANELGVGPRLLKHSRNFLVMELVEGPHLQEWLSAVEEEPINRVKDVVASLLTQCYKLDAAGLDHGELSRAGRHVIVSPGGPVIVDFESSSLSRRPRNLPSIVQYLMVRSGEWPRLSKRLNARVSCEEVFALLRDYKRRPSKECLEDLINLLNLA